MEDGFMEFSVPEHDETLNLFLPDSLSRHQF